MTRRELSIISWAAVLLLIPFLGPLLWGRVHYSGDVMYSFQPWLTYAAQNIQAGHWPLWNPYTACGEPFLANPQVMIYFPFAQVFWFFPFAQAWGAFLALNHVWAFLGVVFLARFLSRGKTPLFLCVLGAAAFAWGGFATVLWEFPSALAALAAVPIFVLASLAGAPAGVVLGGAWLIFAGYPQFAFYAFLLAALGLLIEETPAPLKIRRGFFWGLAAAGAALFALCQILPTMEVTRESLRTAIGPEEARAFLLKIPFLTKLLIPDILPKAGTSYSNIPFAPTLWPIQRNWLNTFFIGHLPLILAAATLRNIKQRRVLFLWSIFVVGILLSFGVEPLFTVIRHLPGLSAMTHFSNAMLLCVLSLALLATQTDPAEVGRPSRVIWTLWGLAAGFVCVLMLRGAGAAVVRSMTGLAALNPAQADWVRRSCIISGAGLLAAGAVFVIPGKYRKAGVLGLTLFQLWLFSRGLHPTAPASFFHAAAPLARLIQQAPGRFVVDPYVLKGVKPMAGDTLEAGSQSLRQMLYPNIHLPFRVSAAWGYEVFQNKNFSEFRRSVPDEFVASPQTIFLGEKHIVTTRPLPRPATLVARRENGIYYTFDGGLEESRWVAQAKTIPDAGERLKYISGPWNPMNEVILEEHDGGAGWRVRSTIFYRGWEAYGPDGRRLPILKANHAFQAVAAQKDEAVTFIYRPRSFFWGILSTVLSILGLVALGWTWVRRTIRS